MSRVVVMSEEARVRRSATSTKLAKLLTEVVMLEWKRCENDSLSLNEGTRLRELNPLTFRNALQFLAACRTLLERVGLWVAVHQDGKRVDRWLETRDDGPHG